MARASRQGVDYFPLNVYLDTKFKLLEAKHGLHGFAVAIKLMQSIYAEGYWLKFGEDEKFLFANDHKINHEEFEAIISTCLEKEIFSQCMYEKYQILTSRGIQKQYREMTKRRKDIEIIEDYLLDVNIMSTSCQHHVSNVSTFKPKMSAEVQLQGDKCIHDVSRSTQTETERETETETERETETETKKIREIGSMWERCGHGLINDNNLQKLIADAEIYSLPWVLEAIEIAGDNGKHNYAYMKAIMTNWYSSGKKEKQKPQEETKKKVIKYFEAPSVEEEARIKEEADKARELMKDEFAKLMGNRSNISNPKQ